MKFFIILFFVAFLIAVESQSQVVKTDDPYSNIGLNF